MPQFITRRPSFSELCEIRDALKDCESSLAALADCPSDVVQRAADFYSCAEELLASARAILTTQETDCD